MIELSHGLLGAAILFAILGIVVGMRPLFVVGSWRSAYEPEITPQDFEDKPVPKGSVIIYANELLDDVENFVPQVLAQDYPNFEVIVVLDVEAESAKRITDRYTKRFPTVYFTFIPPGAHNLSRRKLAFTIGLKAANGDVAVFSSSNCELMSEQWLSRMMRPFCSESPKDMVLGYSFVPISEFTNGSKWYKEFDTFMTNCQWIGAALMGHAFRGDGQNLAISREAFFRNKGFSKNMFLHAGEDDMFVTEIAAMGEIDVVLNPDARVKMLWAKQAARQYVYRKEQLSFTRRYLPKGPFLRAGFLSWCQWLVPLLGAGAVVASLPNFIMMTIAASLTLLIFWALEIAIYRRAAAQLDVTRLFFAVPLFLTWHPIGNLFFRIHHHNTRRDNFTWRRRSRFSLLFSKKR